MAVENGYRARLLIAGVVDSDVGVQTATPGEVAQFGGELVVAWSSSPTQRRLKAGDAAFLAGEKMIVRQVRPSPITKGLLVAYLARPEASPA